MYDLNFYDWNDNEIDSLVQTVKVLFVNIGMGLGIKICAMRDKRNKDRVKTDLGEGRVIQFVDDEEYNHFKMVCQ